jgi:hypothetical protein
VKVLAWVLATGCLGPFAPDVGPRTSTTDGGLCSNAASTNVTVHFQADIRNGVFVRGTCANCHTGTGLGLQLSGLDLTSYSTLRAGGGRSGVNIVVDAMPCASILVQKIGPNPPFGRRMPYNGPPYLADADILLVRDWVAQGAHDN